MIALPGAAGAAPEQIADSRLQLAEALWPSRATARAPARALALEAIAAYRSAGDGNEESAAEVERWLAER